MDVCGQLHVPAARGNVLRYLLDRRLGGPQKNLLPFQESNPGRPARLVFAAAYRNSNKSWICTESEVLSVSEERTASIFIVDDMQSERERRFLEEFDAVMNGNPRNFETS
jgi:hypothetical protein